MTEVFTGATNLITSLGFSSRENFENLKNGVSGLKIQGENILAPQSLPVSLVDQSLLLTKFDKYFTDCRNNYTRLEKMHLLSMLDVQNNSDIPFDDERTIIILTTTKGNIDLLDSRISGQKDRERIYLWKLAQVLQQHFNNPNTPLVISNACISGVLGFIIAKRLIQSGKYDHAIVTGGDIISEFVVSGFMSFQSLDAVACKPFDINRKGLSLGEGVGTVLLSNDHSLIGVEEKIAVTGGSSSNDANHISGPSRTGEGLYQAITGALRQSNLSPAEINFISAHGTATDYNDEMEAKAIAWAGFKNTPVNSLKGYFGHTLGAAGIIESIISIESMRNDLLIKTAGYETHGVSVPINVINENKSQPVNKTLKIASGFGGCNAAIIFENK